MIAFVLLAAPLGPAALAPGPQELRDAGQAMEQRLDAADAIGVALSRVHGRWAERELAAPRADPCADPDAVSLAARARALGRGYRDAVQSARVGLERLERLWAAPTIVPLLDPNARDAATVVRDRVARHVESYLEAASWQGLYVEPRVRACAVTLTPVAGLSWAGPTATDEELGSVAIIGIGGGTVCPTQDPADGRVVVVNGAACYGDAGCRCAPEPVLPGAVLGP